MVSRPVCMMAALLVFLSVSALTTLAQDPARARMEDQSRRESELRNFGKVPPDRSDPRRLEAAKDEVEHDFKRILTIHNEFARVTNSKKPIDFHFVADAAGEVKKRASSLQTILELKAAESGDHSRPKHVKFSDSQVNEALILLCKEIESFVKNPVIATPGTVDAKQTEIAGQDLESIIDLSSDIKKVAERLGKSSP